MLIENGIRVEAVVTRPDKRRGRGSETSPSPVKATAARFNIPCFDAIDTVVAELNNQESLAGVRHSSSGLGQTGLHGSIRAQQWHQTLFS